MEEEELSRDGSAAGHSSLENTNEYFTLFIRLCLDTNSYPIFLQVKSKINNNSVLF